MRRITLKGGLTVSELCFGTANLGRLDSKRAVLRMLETAYEAGITHFDTARLYGHGAMERIVGEFLRGKRDHVTVTTKFGLDPLLQSGRFLLLLNAVKFVVKKLPLLRRRAVRFAHAKVMTANPTEQYSRARAEKALAESLRELNTDYVDLYLLHEANPGMNISDDLLDFLRGKRDAGVIRAFGVGSAFKNIRGASEAVLAAYDVVQFESAMGASNVRDMSFAGGPSVITHGVFQGLSTLTELAKRHPEIAARHAKILGADPNHPQNISRWMLAHAIHANPDGAVLMSTVQVSRLLENVRAAEAPFQADVFENYIRELESAA